VRFLETRRLQGSFKNKVTVVFDGKAGIIGRAGSSLIKIIFSKDETADEKIKRMVEEAKNKKNMIVVTNDRAVQYAARASGAKVSNVSDFLKQTFSEKKGVSKKQLEKIEPVKKISRKVESEITSEMEKIWLKKR